MSDEWVTIPNWDRFQSYTDRSVPWIKLYTELNSDPDWLDLGVAARGMLTTIWVEYARSRGHLRVQKVMSLCGKSARSSHLDSLNHAGFIALSSDKPPSLARAREKNFLRSKKKRAQARDTPAAKPRNPKPTNAKVTGWRLVRGSHGVTHVPDPEGTDRL